MSDGVNLTDFVAFMPQHNYIFKPSGEMWPSSSVNARLAPIEADGEKIAPNKWLDANAPVEQMTWAPGESQIITGRLISDGGWITRPGCAVFNLYRPPTIKPKRGPVNLWLDHINRVFPNDAEHLIAWLAHRVQRPFEKINHALVLGGSQGIGKDTILEPIKQAIGPWNFAEVSPQHMLGRFNGFAKSVILRVSEARDLGDVDRFAFYDHMKAYTAAPPDVLRVDEKHAREYGVFNVCGVIITSNHKTDGIFLPPDDRRHYVAWSPASRDDFDDNYWRRIYEWYGDGGCAHVAEYLATRDIAEFNAKAPPPKTAAFWEIVDASRAPEDSELRDVLDLLGWPDALTLTQICAAAPESFGEWLKDRKNARRIPHRFEGAGYTAVRASSTKDGRWKVSGKNQVIYAKEAMTLRERHLAAEKLAMP